MPIYEFECRQCGYRYEKLQKLSDADPVSCPQCGAEAIHRCVSAPSFRLAGSGWYETDFKKDGEKKQHLAGDAGAPKSVGGGDAGTSATATAAPAPAPAASSGAS